MITMPREIADSDADSDFDSPSRPSASPIPENNVDMPAPSTLEIDPLANLEFDQFLSPTQRLSSAVERQDPSLSRSDNSTDRFLQDLAQTDCQLLDSVEISHGLDGSYERDLNATSRGKAKRTLSDIETGHTKSRTTTDSGGRAAKRAKTYGSSATSRLELSSLFSDGIEAVRPRSNVGLGGSVRLQTDSASTELPVEPLLDPDQSTQLRTSSDWQKSGHNQTFQQRGATTFSQGNIQTNSIATSNLNGYDGINLDFRGAGLSLNMSANPFGSLSQVSLDGDIDPSQTEKFTSLFQHSQQLSTGPPGIELVNGEVAPWPDHLGLMDTSPAEPMDHEEGPSSGRNHNDELQTMSSKSTHKKRGRKPKAKRDNPDSLSTTIDAPDRLPSEDPLNLPPEHYKPRPNRSRADTIDSENSHVSGMSQHQDPSTRKRKRSAAVEAQNSPVKNPSSELHLSDPAMIGVPKELYVPRPSKSRSRRVVQENDPSDKQELPNDETTSNIQNGPELAIVLDDTPVKGTKKKPGRKSKVKRAKTSAAALLKSATMYDEDDKDCIVVDEVPAKVKMDALPEISSVKRETKDAAQNDKVQSGDEEPLDDTDAQQIDDRLPGIKLSVDIPKLSRPNEVEQPANTAEPKKRGRKPKKKADIHVDIAIEEDNEVEALQQNDSTEISTSTANTRQVLSEKDTNASTDSSAPTDPKPMSNSTQEAHKPILKPDDKTQTQSPYPSPKKPVHSPLKPKATIITTTTSTTTTATTTTSILWTKPRVGLSRRTAIPSLLRKLDRSREPPKILERKEKLSKRQQEEEDKRRLEAEDKGEEYVASRWEVRGKDGMLLEWDE